MKIEIVPVWKQVTPELAQELMAFWRDNKAIGDDAAAAARALQAVCIARDEAGTLCGVGTAVVKVLPRLRQPMHYYRQYFAKSLRGHHQELPFYLRAKQVLQDYNAARERPESLGILLEVENGKIAAAYRRAQKKRYRIAGVFVRRHLHRLFAARPAIARVLFRRRRIAAAGTGARPGSGRARRATTRSIPHPTRKPARQRPVLITTEHPRRIAP